MSAESLPAATRLGTVELGVRDPDAVASFYRAVVGLNFLDVAENRVTLGAGAGGDPILSLVGVEGDTPRPETSAGLYHNAFLVPTRAALGGALARVEADWELTGASDHGFSEALYLDDPAGNGIEIYCDRPPEAWPREHGDIQVTTGPLDLDSLRSVADDDRSVPAATTLGHIHLETTDVPAASRFYTDAIGFEITMDFAPSACFFAADDYHHHVAVNAWQGRSTPRDGLGLRWFELLVPEPGYDSLEARLSRSAYPVEARTDGIVVEAPDGISIRIHPID